MRLFTLTPDGVREHPDDAQALAQPLPENGYLWVAMARREFEVMQAEVQAALVRWCGTSLLDLHISDLLNNQLPSHYDYTSDYDVLVFRRLAASQTETDIQHPGLPLHEQGQQTVPKVLRRINTSPVGFAVFDRVLLSIHPADCVVRDAYAERLLQLAAARTRGNGTRLPSGPADLMLRVVNLMVDSYLDLRRELTRELDRWQEELISDKGHFHQWSSMLHTRLALHQLDEICEDQRAAMQDWIEAIKTWTPPQSEQERQDRELLLVRSRDVLEHVERVIHHVDRLERSAETAVQMHFSVQGTRTNDTMKVLTALTAVFLPLNFITGFFGMNFEFLPLIHQSNGIWWAVGGMVCLGGALLLVFWRKRFLANHPH